MSQYSVIPLGENQQQFLDKVKEHAARDADFRKRLIDNPGEAIADYAGVSLPAEIDVRFIENAGADITIVLPDMLSEELDDTDLEKVAGGAWIEVEVCGIDNVCIGDGGSNEEPKSLNN